MKTKKMSKLTRKRRPKNPHKTGKSAMYRAMKIGESIFVEETQSRVSGIVHRAFPPKTFELQEFYLLDKKALKLSKIVKVTKIKETKGEL